MRKLLGIIIFLFITMSCRTNNGDIGLLYGQWILQKLLVDGYPKDGVACDDYSFRFQNDIMQITRQLGHNEYRDYYGTWSIGSSTLTLDFTHAPDESSADSPFSPPPELGMPGDGRITMEIKRISSRRLEFGFTDSDGTVYFYSLTKLI